MPASLSCTPSMPQPPRSDTKATHADGTLRRFVRSSASAASSACALTEGGTRRASFWGGVLRVLVHLDPPMVRVLACGALRVNLAGRAVLLRADPIPALAKSARQDAAGEMVLRTQDAASLRALATSTDNRQVVHGIGIRLTRRLRKSSCSQKSTG